MVHYWGAAAICERIGLGTPAYLPVLRQRFGVPCFLRRKPKSPRNCYYASENMILAWELGRSKAELEAYNAVHPLGPDNGRRRYDERKRALDRPRRTEQVA